MMDDVTLFQRFSNDDDTTVWERFGNDKIVSQIIANYPPAREYCGVDSIIETTVNRAETVGS